MKKLRIKKDWFSLIDVEFLQLTLHYCITRPKLRWSNVKKSKTNLVFLSLNLFYRIVSLSSTHCCHLSSFFNFQDNLPQKCLVMGIFSSKQLVMQNWLSPHTHSTSHLLPLCDKNAISYLWFISAKEDSRENSKQ